MRKSQKFYFPKTFFMCFCEDYLLFSMFPYALFQKIKSDKGLHFVRSLHELHIENALWVGPPVKSIPVDSEREIRISVEPCLLTKLHVVCRVEHLL